MRSLSIASLSAAAFAVLISLLNTTAAFAIGGGYEPFPHTYPFMVRLEKANGDHLCGGALLSSTWVVTAAHCFDTNDPDDVKVILGDHKRSWDELPEIERDIAAGGFHPHPHYTGGTPHDIALIRLSAPVNASYGINWIELGAGDYADGTLLTAMGWGLTHPGQPLPSPTDALLAVELPVVPTTECSFVQAMPSTMLCAGIVGGGVGEPATIGGDSGGPLVIDDPDYGMRLVGVVSQTLGVGVGAYVRVRDYAPWIESVIGTRPPVCSGRAGRSDLGNAFWVQEDSDTIRAEIDTRACNWTGNPVYFATLGGTGGHYNTDGVTSIYAATQTSFFVYVNKPGITVADADSSKWHVNWASVQHNTNVPGVCSGASPSNTWVQHSADSIYMDVSVAACGFGSARSYFTSLYATGGGHSDTRGVTSIFTPTATGFRVYVKKTGVTPAYAAGRSWRVAWRTEPVSVSYEDVCNGKTTAGSTSWTQHNSSTIRVDVDTSACNLSTVPKYFTVLGGTTQHWNTQGATSIYSPTSTGFRVYVTQSGITPAVANSRNWHVVWNARP